MRITVLIFSLCVLGYAIASRGTSIYEMVSGAYQVTLVGAFVPLVAGLYWKRATTQGALLSIALGLVAWLACLATSIGEVVPAQFAGLLGAVVGMLAGSLLPQGLANQHTPHRPVEGL
jgi:Na+/proline symporter